MSFLKPQYEQGHWYEVETTEGTEALPVDLVGSCPTRDGFRDYLEGDYLSHERVSGIGVRLSAPGYMDSTPWTVFETREQARKYLQDVLDVDPDTGESLE